MPAIARRPAEIDPTKVGLWGGVISSFGLVEGLRLRGVPSRWSGNAPASFSALSDDSRNVAPGTLFCAIRGIEDDGHRHLAAADAAGASAAIVEVPTESVPLAQLVVRDSRIATAHAAALFHADPAAELGIVGITGTNGKTSTSWILRHLLAESGPAFALGTLGEVDARGVLSGACRLTTPGPIELAERLRAMCDAGAEYLVMEVSSHALDQHRVDAVPIACAVFTNLGREHLDYHDSMEAYRKTKLGLIERVVESGTCVLNADDPAWREVDPSGRRRLTYGIAGEADVSATGLHCGPAGSEWRISFRDASAQIRLPLVGEFNVYNALAAAAAALALGVPLKRVAARLADAPRVPGRMEELARSPCLVVRDYAHTPDALALVLRTLRRVTSGKLILVFGCGGDRDRGKRPLMGRVAIEGADRVILTEDNPRTEDVHDILTDIAAGLPVSAVEVMVDRRAAIALALSEAQADDTLLLAGKGHESYQIIGHRKIPFDEAEIVAALTARRAP